MDTVSTPNSLAGSQKTWGLDAVGNWDSTTTDGGAAVNRDHNAQNQLEDLDTGSGSGGQSFDDNGNTTADHDGRTLAFDAWNRLVSLHSGTNAVRLYDYDAVGRRTGESVGTSVDLYYSSAWQVLEERESGLTELQNVWSPFYVDDLILRDRDNDNTLDGALDTSFSGDGKDYTDGGPTFAYAVALQADGKTIMAGAGGTGDFTLVRHTLAGVEDTTFDGDGKAYVTFTNAWSEAFAVAVQDDGKIVLAGRRANHFAVWRLNTEDSADTTFNTTGLVTTVGATGWSFDNKPRAATLCPRFPGLDFPGESGKRKPVDA